MRTGWWHTLYLSGQRGVCMGMLLALLASCTFPGGKEKEVTGSSPWYGRFQVSGAEDEEWVTVKLQFQEDDPDGEARHPGPGFSVQLDGVALDGDSTAYSGYFFEGIYPAAGFAGSHAIRVHWPDGAVFTDSFEFRPLRLSRELPETLQSSSLVLDLQGLATREAIRLLLTDTSFFHDGVNRLFPVTEGSLLIPEMEWADLSPGPLRLELIREWEKPLSHAAVMDGILQIHYRLSRELHLEK